MLTDHRAYRLLLAMCIVLAGGGCDDPKAKPGAVSPAGAGPSAAKTPPAGPVSGQASWKEAGGFGAFHEYQPAVDKTIALRDGFAVWNPELRVLFIILTDGSWTAEIRQHALNRLREGYQTRYDQPHLALAVYKFRKPGQAPGTNPVSWDDLGGKEEAFPSDMPPPAELGLAERYRISFMGFGPSPANTIRGVPATETNATAELSGNPGPGGEISAHLKGEWIEKPTSGNDETHGKRWDLTFKLPVYGPISTTRPATLPATKPAG